MIRNYLRIALRNFKRQKGFTLLNVIGLAVGLASAAFIFLFIIDEYGFDRFHPDAGNIYVLGAQGKYNGMQSATVMAPGAWVQALKDEFPEVKSATQMLSPGFPASFRNSEVDRIVLSEQFFCVTPDFKDVFYFSLTHGNPATAFKDNRSVVLSETACACA